VLGPLLVVVIGGSCGTSPATPPPLTDVSAADASAAEDGVSADDAGPTPATDGSTADTTGPVARLPFGATCNADADCETSVCFSFGDGTNHCSLACTDAAACPVGAHGQKCNGKGYCAY
jgi:hypothetical protein